MNIKTFSFLGAAALLLLSGCKQKPSDGDQVVSQRYVHKYGYAVTKQEWDEKNYPGQVISHLKNGVTITSTYENGVQHGPCTYTFPNSQTIATYELYNNGQKVKEIHYNETGMPLKEKVTLSPTRYAVTMWYAEGSPMCVEEFASDELTDGQYFNASNEQEAKIEKGNGVRIKRDLYGHLLMKEDVQGGYVVKKETFFANGTPESISTFTFNKLQGEKKIFNELGEPVAIEEYVNDLRHGKSTYLKNGVKHIEISYLFGQKNGLERHFSNGEHITQEICWENDKKHGPSIYYVNGYPRTEWYYGGEQLSKARYDELIRLDEMVSQISPEVRKNPR